MLIDNLGIMKFGSCSDFIMCQPKSRWKIRIGGVRISGYNPDIAKTRKQTQRKCYNFLPVVFRVKRANLTEILKYGGNEFSVYTLNRKNK